VKGLLGIPPAGDSVCQQRDVMRTPQPEEFRGLHPRRATLPPNFSNPNLDSRLLVGQPEPVVRTFVLQAVHSKTRLDTTQINPKCVGPSGIGHA